MGDRIDTFVERAHLALPRFELYRLHKGKLIYGSHLSDILVDDAGFPHVREPEDVRARFLCLATIATATSENGKPHRLDLWAKFGLAPAAQGGANVVVTDKRLAGVISTGDSFWGALTADLVIVRDLDLRDVDALALTAKSGLLGEKERPVMVQPQSAMDQGVAA